MNIVGSSRSTLACLMAALSTTVLGGCHSVSPTVVRGPQAQAITGLAVPGVTTGAYLLGPADVLNVTVLYEPELSLEEATVDSDGGISVPLIGTVSVRGKTAGQVASEIERQLAGRYLREPHVAVNVVEYARQSVTVEGAVESPGLYKIPGSSSLLQTVALARGPSRTAKLDEVIVFRTVNGQRMAAVFDLRRIRSGYEPDPLVLGGDTVVVGYSELKGAFRDFIGAAPALSVFRPY